MLLTLLMRGNYAENEKKSLKIFCEGLSEGFSSTSGPLRKYIEFLKIQSLLINTTLLHIYLLLMPILQLSEKCEILLGKCFIFHIPIALNINFYKVKSSRDTKICRKVNFQNFWTELRREFCFLGYLSQNSLRLIYEIE